MTGVQVDYQPGDRIVCIAPSSRLADCHGTVVRRVADDMYAVTFDDDGQSMPAMFWWELSREAAVQMRTA